MKADLIYSIRFGYYHRDRSAEIARSGKTVKMGAMTNRIGTYLWGLADPSMCREAQAINDAQQVLDNRCRAFNAKLLATQPDLIAAAKVSPMTPKVAQEPLVLGPLDL